MIQYIVVYYQHRLNNINNVPFNTKGNLILVYCRILMSVCYKTNYLYKFIYSCILLKYIISVSYCLANNKIANLIFNLILNNLVQINNNIELKNININLDSYGWMWNNFI